MLRKRNLFSCLSLSLGLSLRLSVGEIVSLGDPERPFAFSPDLALVFDR
jgi:hypothetical protein